jgi:DNA-directed RNA polymerase specialized sigma24 family protein
MKGDLRGFLGLVLGGVAAERLGEKTDAELIEQFLTGRDDAAFAAILRRHGPMVYRVCRLTLRHDADAEDRRRG